MSRKARRSSSISPRSGLCVPAPISSRFPRSSASISACSALSGHRHAAGDEVGGRQGAGDGDQGQERDPHRVLKDARRQAAGGLADQEGPARVPRDGDGKDLRLALPRKDTGHDRARCRLVGEPRKGPGSARGPIIGIELVPGVVEQKERAGSAVQQVQLAEQRVAVLLDLDDPLRGQERVLERPHQRHVALVLDDDRRLLQERIHVRAEGSRGLRPPPSPPRTTVRVRTSRSMRRL